MSDVYTRFEPNDIIYYYDKKYRVRYVVDIMKSSPRIRDYYYVLDVVPDQDIEQYDPVPKFEKVDKVDDVAHIPNKQGESRN